MAIQSMIPNGEKPDEILTDDELALKEAQERGITEDEEFYFRSVGLI